MLGEVYISSVCVHKKFCWFNETKVNIKMISRQMNYDVIFKVLFDIQFSNYSELDARGFKNEGGWWKLHTHTHTHIYIYMCLYLCTQVHIFVLIYTYCKLIYYIKLVTLVEGDPKAPF